jgi:hypothetical protein
MGESFDHRPAGWIRQSSKCCTQFIHNHMVVDCLPMSSMNFAIPDFCSLMLFHQLLEASERHNLGERLYGTWHRGLSQLHQLTGC